MASHRKAASPVKEFEDELKSVLEKKPPVSKAKVQSVTALGIKYVRHYKLVVHAVEKFIHKARTEFKLPGLYFIDAIVRHSLAKFKDKDMYRDRFQINLAQTFNQLMKCSADDKDKMMKVAKMWRDKKVFSAEVLDSLVPTDDEKPDLIQINSGIFAGGNLGAKPVQDDFDYGSDEDESERIAEMQKTYNKQREALNDIKPDAGELLSSLSKINSLAAGINAGISAGITSAMAGGGSLSNAVDPRAMPPAKITNPLATERHVDPPVDPRATDPRKSRSRAPSLNQNQGKGVVQRPGSIPSGPVDATKEIPMPQNGPRMLTFSSKSVYVASLPSAVTQSQMASFFSKAGPVARLWMDMKEDNNTAYCILQDRAIAEKAHAAAKSQLEGKRGTHAGWMRPKALTKIPPKSVRWDEASGVASVPLGIINSINLPIICVDSVVDRQTAPQDMLPDLDRFEAGLPAGSSQEQGQQKSGIVHAGRGLPARGMIAVPGRGMPGMAGRGMPGMAGRGMPGMTGRGMPGMAGRGMPGMAGRGMPPGKSGPGSGGQGPIRPLGAPPGSTGGQSGSTLQSGRDTRVPGFVNKPGDKISFRLSGPESQDGIQGTRNSRIPAHDQGSTQDPRRNPVDSQYNATDEPPSKKRRSRWGSADGNATNPTRQERI